MSVLGIHTWVTAESANKQQMICNFCSIATLSNPIALNERLKIKESENKDISYIARELFADFASYRALSTQKKHPYLLKTRSDSSLIPRLLPGYEARVTPEKRMMTRS